MVSRRVRKRIVLGVLALLGLAAGSVLRDMEGPWWRTVGKVETGGAVYAGPDGMVMVRSDGPDGSEYTGVRPNGVVESFGGPRLSTPWFIVPYSRTGVLVHPVDVKIHHDPCLTRVGDRWNFDSLGSGKVEIVGGAPFARTPDGPQPKF